jgi:hypothetical protein
MSRLTTFLNTIGDIAKLLYNFWFLLFRLVSLAVLIVIFADTLCIEGLITTHRAYVLVATTAVVSVSVAIVFCHDVTDALLGAKMATALRIALNVDCVTTPQDVADLVDDLKKQRDFANASYWKLSRTANRERDVLQSENEELRKQNETLESKNVHLQQENATFRFILNDSRYMSAAPAPAVVAAAGAQV